MNHVHARQRGSVYITVLGAAMVATILGLSALLTVRIERRTAQAVTESQQARYMAQSAVEYALLRLNNDLVAWRTLFINDTWTPAIAVGDASIRFKITDEADSQLNDDATEPATLTGRAVVGDAVRMYSVTIETYVSPAPNNMLQNPGMESGVTSWFADPAGKTTLVAVTGGAHGGNGYMRVGNRLLSSAGPAQTVTGLINGQSYYVEAWMRTGALSATASITMDFTTSSGAQTTIPVTTLIGSGWTKVSGVLNVNWIGTLQSARLKIGTLSVLSDVYVDDVMLVSTSTPPDETRIVAGTWRQVVE